MDTLDQRPVTTEDLALMLGVRDIEIYALQKRLEAAIKKINELTPKPIEKAANTE